MRNLLNVLLLGLIIVSCSKDDVLIDNSENSKLLLNAKSNDLTTSIFKGTYVATGTQIRGHVLVILNEDDARASITLTNNTELKFESVTSVISDLNMRSIVFESEAGTFTLTANDKGENPVISDLTVQGINGSIVLAKDVSTMSISTMTGTFGCDDCENHPVLSAPEVQETFVWNMVFIRNERGDVVQLITQTTYGAQTIIGDGFVSNVHTGFGGAKLCDMSGSYNYSAAGVVNWNAEHMMLADESCESLTGVWNFSSPLYDIEGWLRSDSTCITGTDDDDSGYTYCNEAQTKALICHNGNTLCVSVNAIAAHLAHGDELGSCD